MAKFCTKCGSPLKEGIKFCTKCGNPVSNVAKVTQNTEVLRKETIIDDVHLKEEQKAKIDSDLSKNIDKKDEIVKSTEKEKVSASESETIKITSDYKSSRVEPLKIAKPKRVRKPLTLNMFLFFVSLIFMIAPLVLLIVFLVQTIGGYPWWFITITAILFALGVVCLFLFRKNNLVRKIVLAISMVFSISSTIFSSVCMSQPELTVYIFPYTTVEQYLNNDNVYEPIILKTKGKYLLNPEIKLMTNETLVSVKDPENTLHMVFKHNYLYYEFDYPPKKGLVFCRRD